MECMTCGFTSAEESDFEGGCGSCGEDKSFRRFDI